MNNLRRVRSGGLVISHGLWKHGISLKALGLLYMLLDLSELPDWSFSVEGLASLSETHGMGDGKAAIRTGLLELEEALLLRRSQERGPQGFMGRSIWEVSDLPMGVEGLQTQPFSDYRTAADRTQQYSLSKEEEKNPIVPLIKEPDNTFVELVKELWNHTSPTHWAKIRDIGKARSRTINSLLREFDTATAALDALEKSLLQACQEPWCMKSSTKLAFENWMTNNKVRTFSEKYISDSETPVRQVYQDIIDKASSFPQFFLSSDYVMTTDGEEYIFVKYTSSVISAAGYPISTKIYSLDSLNFDISHLMNLFKPTESPF